MDWAQLDKNNWFNGLGPNCVPYNISKPIENLNQQPQKSNGAPFIKEFKQKKRDYVHNFSFLIFSYRFIIIFFLQRWKKMSEEENKQDAEMEEAPQSTNIKEVRNMENSTITFKIFFSSYSQEFPHYIIYFYLKI